MSLCVIFWLMDRLTAWLAGRETEANVHKETVAGVQDLVEAEGDQEDGEEEEEEDTATALVNFPFLILIRIHYREACLRLP